MLLNLQFHSCKTVLFHRTSSDSKSKNWLGEVQGMGAVAELKKLLTEAERNGLSELHKISNVIMGVRHSV